MEESIFNFILLFLIVNFLDLCKIPSIILPLLNSGVWILIYLGIDKKLIALTASNFSASQNRKSTELLNAWTSENKLKFCTLNFSQPRRFTCRRTSQSAGFEARARVPTYQFSSANHRLVSFMWKRNKRVWSELLYTLRPESSENIPIRLQEADLYFSNQNDLRNPKMGSKQSVVVATAGWFFQITFLGRKNHRKNRTVWLLIHSLVILTP